MARRGPSEGSVYQRSDGRWVAAMSVGYRSGKRRRKVVYAPTRREVLAKLRALQQANDAGLRIDQDRVTVAQFLDAWLAEVVRPNLRPATVRTYETNVRVHLKPALGQIRLVGLRASDVQAMVNGMAARGRSARTIAMARDVIRGALNLARRWDLVPRNVAEMIDVPRAAPKERLFLDSRQAKDFIEAIRDHRLAALYLMAVTTGLRQGELLGLRWADIDMDQGELRVSVALSRGSGSPMLMPPKTARSRRVLIVPAVVIAGLRAHRTRQLEERLLSGARWTESGLVFTTSTGTALDGGRVTRSLQSVLAVAGLPRLTFHDLRHSCASLLLAQGVPARVVMEILGHSDVRLTMNLYTHVAQELQREASDRMDAFLREAT